MVTFTHKGLNLRVLANTETTTLLTYEPTDLEPQFGISIPHVFYTVSDPAHTCSNTLQPKKNTNNNLLP